MSLCSDWRDRLQATTAAVTFVTNAHVRRTNHMNGDAPTIHEPA